MLLEKLVAKWEDLLTLLTDHFEPGVVAAISSVDSNNKIKPLKAVAVNDDFKYAELSGSYFCQKIVDTRQPHFSAGEKLKGFWSPKVAYVGEPLYSGENLVGIICIFSNPRKELEFSKALISQFRRLIESELEVNLVNDQLRTSHEQMNSFLKVLSHDVVNPLAAAMSYCELATFDSATKEKLHSLIQPQLDAILKLVRMDAIPKVDHDGRLILSEENLFDLLDQAVVSMSPYAEERNVEIVVDDSCDLPVVCERTSTVYSVINNLIKNSIKFTPAQGTVRIRAEKSGDETLVHIEDSGRGFTSKQIQSFAKDRFVDSTTGLRGEVGKGYGLTLASEQMQLNGGDMTIGNLGSEGGARITLTFLNQKEKSPSLGRRREITLPAHA